MQGAHRLAAFLLLFERVLLFWLQQYLRDSIGIAFLLFYLQQVATVEFLIYRKPEGETVSLLKVKFLLRQLLQHLLRDLLHLRRLKLAFEKLEFVSGLFVADLEFLELLQLGKHPHHVRLASVLARAIVAT